MTTDEALKMAIKDHEEIMMHAGVLYPREFGKSFLKTYEAMKEALEQPSNMVAVPLDKLQDMQRRLSDCEEYLKEDETPAECIARNRKDANTTLKLLAKSMGEKKALEQPTVAKLNDEYLRDTYVDGLNQPAQEPVAWMDENNYVFEKASDIDSGGIKIPLYTHPHQWQGLTDDEIETLAHEHNLLDDYPHKFARAIEQALKDKNT